MAARTTSTRLQYLLFSIRERLGTYKYWGMIAAALVCAIMMALVDDVFLPYEGALLYNVSLGFTALLKIALAVLFGGLVVINFPIRHEENPHRDEQDAAIPQSYRELQQAGIFVSVSIAVMLLLSSFIDENTFGITAFSRRFGASLCALIFVAMIVRQLEWVDALLQQRRTAFTEQFRMIALVVGVMLIVLRVFELVTGIDAEAIHVVSMTILAMLLLIASSRVSWISSLTKDQKWKAFAVSSLAMVMTIAFMVSREGLEHITIMDRLLPGLYHFSSFAALLACIFFLRVSFALALALPTAAAMDRKMNEVRSLASLSRAIAQVYDLEQLLTMTTTMIRDVCGATSSWIELESSEANGTHIAAHINITDDELQALYKHGVLHASIARRGMQGLYIEALDEEPSFAEICSSLNDRVQSLIAVPLMLEHHRIGTLFAAHREKFAFENEDIALLTAFASNISIAIENVRLFEQSVEQERLKREMMLAREIQYKLLPKQQPHLTAFDIAAYTSPALEVGGDYYDYVTLSNGMRCVLIGDVSGKGISAALYMAELKGVVLAVAAESTSAADILCRINTALKGNLERGVYVTMTAVALNEETRELLIARAGHTPILLVRNGIPYFLQPRGIGIALADAQAFRSALEEVRVPMAYHDVCLLFTDGVNEALNEEQKEFGVQALQSALMQNHTEARFIVGEVVRRVAEFSQGMSQHDDMTVIAILAREHDAACCEHLPEKHPLRST
ncbi:MAG: SpoIIE family protein phosphatase [Bacteroidota bacterium]|nr:SpoIIE family protein phosphatase [Candidatus Kapabacteria bacterium]MDW8219538.1 SpoIIE family protein phosphatase [Bacteroidota bacterium]